MKGNGLPLDARMSIGAPADETVCGPCHPDADCYNSAVPTPRKEGRVLKNVLDYQNEEVVLRIADKFDGNIDKGRKCFFAYLQYMDRVKVAIKSSSPTKYEDIGWHEHILFTRDYAQFCLEYVGFFVHHVPTPRLKQGEKAGAPCNSSCLAGDDPRAGKFQLPQWVRALVATIRGTRKAKAECGCGPGCGSCLGVAASQDAAAPATCGSNGGGKAFCDGDCDPAVREVTAMMPQGLKPSCGHCSTDKV